jgi:Heterokaryon incompatibility protein (HET)
MHSADLRDKTNCVRDTAPSGKVQAPEHLPAFKFMESASPSSSTNTDTETDNEKELESPTLPATLPALYQPLQQGEIRLLGIRPGGPTELLRCTLQRYPLNTKYYALSYVWGDPAQPRNISCNEYSLPIGRNLHAALLNIRKSVDDALLWVDALCIYSHRTTMKYLRTVRFEP